MGAVFSWDYCTWPTSCSGVCLAAFALLACVFVCSKRNRLKPTRAVSIFISTFIIDGKEISIIIIIFQRKYNHYVGTNDKTDLDLIDFL